MKIRGRNRSGLAHKDSGSGLFSTTFGVLMFLMFMLLATHTLVNLWVRSTVIAVADSTARDVAYDPAVDTDPAGVQRRALSRARRLLGGHAENVSLTFEPDPTGLSIVLHVTAAPAGILATSPIGSIDERIRIRKETR